MNMQVQSVCVGVDAQLSLSGNNKWHALKGEAKLGLVQVVVGFPSVTTTP
jgi:hypothetical protein